MKLLALVLRYALAAFAVGLVWHAGSLALGSELLPDPAATLAAFVAALGATEFQHHAGLSLARLAGGLCAALLIGFPLGLLLGRLPKLDRVLSPVIFITYPVPKIVLLPVFFMLVGLGDASRVLLIALTTGYPVLVIVREAALALDPAYERAFRSMGGGTFGLLRHVWLPAALPSLFTALKVASGTAIAVLFLAESFATDAGLGWLVMDAWGMGDVERMFSGILGMSLLGVLLYGGVCLLERRFAPWCFVHGRAR